MQISIAKNYIVIENNFNSKENNYHLPQCKKEKISIVYFEYSETVSIKNFID